MEVKDGYKKTDIGVIPEDWDTITYEKAFAFLSTATYSRDMLSKDGDVVYIHYGDVHTKFEHKLDFVMCSLSFVTKEMAKNYNFIKDGDVIMVDASEDYSGIGKSVEVKNIGDKNAISGLHTFLLRDKNNVFVNGFKSYIHKNQLVKSSYDRLATGLKVFGVSKKNLKTIQIPYPPEHTEQKAIATALSDTDELIASLDKLIIKKRNIKQATMQQLLTGKKRLPGFSGEWNEKPFTEVFRKHSAKNYQIQSIDYIVSGQIPVVDQGKKDIVAYTDNSNKRFSCPTNGIIVFGDHTRIIKYINFDFAVGADGTQLLSTQNNFSTIFFYYQLLTKEIPNTGYNRHFKFILEMIFSTPSFEEQQAIAKVLTEMDSEIEALEQKRDKYEAIKKGMMQELLTGKTRLV